MWPSNNCSVTPNRQTTMSKRTTPQVTWPKSSNPQSDVTGVPSTQNAPISATSLAHYIHDYGTYHQVQVSLLPQSTLVPSDVR